MCSFCPSRRGLFSGIGSLAVTAALGAAASKSALAQPTRSVETPDAALARLMEGNGRYASGKL